MGRPRMDTPLVAAGELLPGVGVARSGTSAACRQLPKDEAGVVCVRASGPLTDIDHQAVADFREVLASAPRRPPA